MILTGQRNLETILAVRPDSEFTTIAFAFTSTAMEQAEWELLPRAIGMFANKKED